MIPLLLAKLEFVTDSCFCDTIHLTDLYESQRNASEGDLDCTKQDYLMTRNVLPYTLVQELVGLVRMS